MPSGLRLSMHAGIPLVLALALGWTFITGGGDKGVIFVFPLALWCAVYVAALLWRRRRATAAGRWAWGAAGIATLAVLCLWIVAVLVLRRRGM